MDEGSREIRIGMSCMMLLTSNLSLATTKQDEAVLSEKRRFGNLVLSEL